jgi:exosome complex exonuclease DIS3/RRP44
MGGFLNGPKMNRIAAGALELASPEVRFLLDKTEGTPTDVEMYQLKDTHSLVEEFMLLCMSYISPSVLKSDSNHDGI